MLKVDLEKEDDAARFHGVHIKHNLKIWFLNMMQKGLINWDLAFILEL